MVGQNGICCRHITSFWSRLGLGSFVLNARRFSWGRFLPFAAVSVLWGVFMQNNPLFAVVFAAVVGPNCQEWYLDRFGTEGRLGRLWTLWSTGGRLVTLALIFLMVSLDITGWGNTLREVQFGLGYRPDDFALEAARFSLATARLPGISSIRRCPKVTPCSGRDRPSGKRTSTVGSVTFRRSCWTGGRKLAGRRSAKTMSRPGSPCSTSTKSAPS